MKNSDSHLTGFPSFNNCDSKKGRSHQNGCIFKECQWCSLFCLPALRHLQPLLLHWKESSILWLERSQCVNHPIALGVCYCGSSHCCLMGSSEAVSFNIWCTSSTHCWLHPLSCSLQLLSQPACLLHQLQQGNQVQAGGEEEI